MQVALYHHVENIPNEIFQVLNTDKSFYFSRAFLKVFEENNPHIEYSYLVLRQETNIVAMAIIQHIMVSLDNATKQIPLHDKIAHQVRCFINGRKTQISVCGNVFLSGNYGVFIADQADHLKVYKTISKHILNSNSGKKSSVYFFKDYIKNIEHNIHGVKKNHFIEFQVEPNMRLEIKSHWKNFDDYKADLKSKYRVKINKADSNSTEIQVIDCNASMINEHSTELQQLLNNITDKAVIKSVAFQVSTYAALKQQFPDRVHFKTYWYGGKIIGFATAFIHPDVIDAHFIGMDYELNKQLSIYPRILNDYVRLAINCDVKELNLGRTSSEIKSTLGALPEQLICFVRHKRSMANLIFKPIIKQVKMTPYKQHQPFKKKTGAVR